jgi:hypothetical protein
LRFQHQTFIITPSPMWSVKCSPVASLGPNSTRNEEIEISETSAKIVNKLTPPQKILGLTCQGRAIRGCRSGAAVHLVQGKMMQFESCIAHSIHNKHSRFFFPIRKNTT